MVAEVGNALRRGDRIGHIMSPGQRWGVQAEAWTQRSGHLVLACVTIRPVVQAASVARTWAVEGSERG